MIVSEDMPSPDCHDDPTNQHGTGFLSNRHGCQLGIEGIVSKKREAEEDWDSARFRRVTKIDGCNTGIGGSLAQRTNVDQGRSSGHVLGGDDQTGSLR
jgi:hypothetical protein